MLRIFSFFAVFIWQQSCGKIPPLLWVRGNDNLAISREGKGVAMRSPLVSRNSCTHLAQFFFKVNLHRWIGFFFLFGPVSSEKMFLVQPWTELTRPDLEGVLIGPPFYNFPILSHPTYQRCKFSGNYQISYFLLSTVWHHLLFPVWLIKCNNFCSSQVRRVPKSGVLFKSY